MNPPKPTKLSKRVLDRLSSGDLKNIWLGETPSSGVPLYYMCPTFSGERVLITFPARTPRPRAVLARDLTVRAIHDGTITNTHQLRVFGEQLVAHIRELNKKDKP